ncbi:MAG TPA: cytochrome B6, partial [Candidatus Dormibacteraeota bacterium]
MVIAITVVGLLAVLLTILFSSPDERPSTVAQWSRQLPVDFAKTATAELGGTSATAEYGPPYNHNKASEQHIAFIRLQKWLGVSHP